MRNVSFAFDYNESKQFEAKQKYLNSHVVEIQFCKLMCSGTGLWVDKGTEKEADLDIIAEHSTFHHICM